MMKHKLADALNLLAGMGVALAIATLALAVAGQTLADLFK